MVLFDADNTLLNFSLAEKKAHKRVSLEYGIPYSEELYKTYSAINDKWWKSYEKKLFTRDEIIVNRFVEYLEFVGVSNVDPIEFNRKYRLYLSDGKDAVNGAYETLKAIKEMGAKIYIVTNGVAHVQNSRLKCQPFYKFIDGICISEDTGYAKPDVDFFTTASKKHGIVYNEKTLIVGDSLTSDIKGGNNIGIDTCWFNPNSAPLKDGYIVTYTVKDLKEIIDIVKGDCN